MLDATEDVEDRNDGGEPELRRPVGPRFIVGEPARTTSGVPQGVDDGRGSYPGC